MSICWELCRYCKVIVFIHPVQFLTLYYRCTNLKCEIVLMMTVLLHPKRIKYIKMAFETMKIGIFDVLFYIEIQANKKYNT